MVRNVKEVSLIQVRQGNLSELPKPLHQGEIGLAKDVNRLFIGNPDNTELSTRTEFPYQNIEILTEFSDMNMLISYLYENNIVKVNGVSNREKYIQTNSVIGYCTVDNPIISKDSKLKINDIELEFQINQNIDNIISNINSISSQSGLFATKLLNENKITLINVSKSMSIENIDDGTVIEDIGIPNSINSFAEALPSRYMKDKLNDVLYITDFGINPTNEEDCSEELYKAFYSIYKVNTDPQFYRSVYMPCGKYSYSNESLNIPFTLLSNMHIYGDGIDRTIITSNKENKLLLSNDILNESYTNNVLIENLTFNNTFYGIGLLKNCQNLTFNNVKFTGNLSSVSLELNNCNEVSFHNCIFENGNQAILCNNCSSLNFINCIFTNISNEVIHFISTNNSSINNNLFKNSSSNSNSVIYIDENSKYNNITNNKFDESVLMQWGTTIPYISNNSYNFCDIINPNKNQKTYLKYGFMQPKFDYITSLTDLGGNDIYSTFSMSKSIDSYSLNYYDNENGNLNLINLPTSLYGKNIILDDIEIDLTNQFKKIDQNDAISYNIGLTFEAKDIVTDGNNYYCVIKSHTVENNTLPNEYVEQIIFDNNNIKYMDIVIKKDNKEYSLLSSFNENSVIHGISLFEYITYSKTSFTDFIEGNSYNNNSIVLFNSELFKINYTDGSQNKILYKEDLFNLNNATRLYTHGKHYHFDVSGLLYNLTDSKFENLQEFNLIDSTLNLVFYDENYNKLTDVNTWNLIFGANALIKLFFSHRIKIENSPAIQYTFTINPTPSDATVKITVDGNTYYQNSITANINEFINWEVSKDGYISQSGTEVLNQNITLNITLENNIVDIILNNYIGDDSNVILPTENDDPIDLSNFEYEEVTI